MIRIKANQNIMIPFVLGSGFSHPRESEDLILDPLDKTQGKQVENDKRLEIVLVGENASVEVIGLVLAKGSDDKSIDANIVHAAPNTKSNVNVRAVLKGKAQFSFRGNVRIEKGAKGADAYLRSDAMLFDDAKMGDDTPALEILEKDVKAGHAATVGKVDEQMLFYLMSRGISRLQAEKMLVEGFIEPILNKLNVESLTTNAKRSVRL